MYNFCTYFDNNFLYRGLALYHSLSQHCEEEFCLWVLCLDDETFEFLNILNYKWLKTIHLNDIEKDDKKLLVAKQNRNKLEYFWTLTPSLPLYLFRKNPKMEKIFYIDADMYFFSSPITLFEELGDRSILIVPHDHSVEYKSSECAGKYNVGTLIFRADEKGLLCLNWWRKRCLEWCYDWCEDGKFGDQGYLNNWPEHFEGVVVSEKIGARMAPWNLSKYSVSISQDHRLFVDEEPLICYHFHSMYFCTSWLVFLASWPINMSTKWRDLVYKPYIQKLKAIEADLLAQGHNLTIPIMGFPWRYIGGRILKGQPIRHFMIVNN